MARLTRSRVFKTLKANLLTRNSGDYRDYETGKALFLNGKYIKGDDYENLIRFIAEYFDV